MTAARKLDDADRAWIRRQVDAAPKLTPDQRIRLAELLRPVRKPAGGSR